jgi:hypothetical protein
MKGNDRKGKLIEERMRQDMRKEMGTRRKEYATANN